MLFIYIFFVFLVLFLYSFVVFFRYKYGDNFVYVWDYFERVSGFYFVWLGDKWFEYVCCV